MNDFDNFMSGKDWTMTITIPSRVLHSCPEKVMELQNTIQFDLLKFNADIKGMEKVTLGKPMGGDGILLDEKTKQAVVSKMNADEEKRRGGGRL